MRGLLKGGVFYVLVWEGMWSPVRYYVTGGLSLVRCCVTGGFTVLRDEYFELFTVSFFLVLIKPPL